MKVNCKAELNTSFLLQDHSKLKLKILELSMKICNFILCKIFFSFRRKKGDDLSIDL